MNVPTLEDFIDMVKAEDIETFELSDEQFTEFEARLQQSPNPSENLISLMSREPQWLKSEDQEQKEYDPGTVAYFLHKVEQRLKEEDK